MFMKSFEPVYRELEDLFIKKLPEYIQKINIEHNDGIIIKPFQNTKLDEDCLRQPCLKFKMEESEYLEKDRIIENTVFIVSFEIKLMENEKKKITFLWRYVEAFNRMLKEIESKTIFNISKIKDLKIFIRIII